MKNNGKGKGEAVLLLLLAQKDMYLFVYMVISFQGDISETVQGCVMPLDKAFRIMEVSFLFLFSVFLSYLMYFICNLILNR